MRLSAYLAQQFGISRRFAKTLIHDGKVSVTNHAGFADIIKADIITTGGDYKIDMPSFVGEYDIEDYLLQNAGAVLFLYKPAAMHSERLNPAEPLCISDIVAGSFPEYSLISRLDYSVSGVLAAVRQGTVIESQEKCYIAKVEGRFPAELIQRWDVDAAKRRQVSAYQSNSGILMHFSCLEVDNSQSLVEIILEKAHRHQVRATLAALGHPIIGDTLYNGQNEAPEHIELRCVRVMVNGISNSSPLIIPNESF
ncbi:MAG: hypothetical protein LBV04_00425 [Deferribacteraceae bacterium]|jgi:23S rRNA pseudouridine1911/1915/1917 synthase|nr:hypothetical protein [Deferribacteraceae bacterium]